MPARSVKELIALAKARPGALNYASAGTGTPTYLAVESFKRRAGIDLVHVPYKGAAASMAGLLGNQVEVMFEGPGSVPHMKSGKLRGLGVSSLKRSAVLPDLPTVAEQGVPGYEMSSWLGVSTQAAVPRAIVERLHTEIGAWLSAPQMAERLASQNLEATYSTPEQMTERVRLEIPMWVKVMKSAGIEPE